MSTQTPPAAPETSQEELVEDTLSTEGRQDETMEDLEDPEDDYSTYALSCFFFVSKRGYSVLPTGELCRSC